MPGFERETTIDAPPAQVFDVLTDLEKATEYIPGIVKVRPLTDQPFGNGYQWRETRRFKVLGFIPVRGSSTLSVTEYSKAKRTYTTTFDDGCNFVAYRFAVKRGATRGTSTVQLAAECKGIGKYLGDEKVAAKLTRMMEKYDGDLLNRVKNYVEGAGNASRIEKA